MLMYERSNLHETKYKHFTLRASKSSHITHSLRSLHWLKIKERIDYKVLSLAYKVLTTTDPTYHYGLISLQPHRSTRYSDVVTLARIP